MYRNVKTSLWFCAKPVMEMELKTWLILYNNEYVEHKKDGNGIKQIFPIHSLSVRDELSHHNALDLLS